MSKEPFVFLMNKGWRHNLDRGGAQYCIQAYLEEFTKEDNVLLIFKVNSAYGIPNLDKLLLELGYNKDSPSIEFDIGNYKYEDLVKLYNKCDVFVSPTRAEAFNIPCAESLACSIPCIVTGYGGQCDFIKDGVNGLYIDYDMTEVTWELQYEGISWAKPKIEDLRKKLRYAYEHPKQMKEMGKKGLEIIRDYTWNKTAKKIVNLI